MATGKPTMIQDWAMAGTWKMEALDKVDKAAFIKREYRRRAVHFCAGRPHRAHTARRDVDDAE